jgi:NADH dehydrogenase
MTTDSGSTGVVTPRATPRVAIIGAGFGGLTAAKKLSRKGFAVTIVDKQNYHAFLPLLYQVATAGLNPADVAYPVRGLFQRRRNVLFRQAEATGIDWDRREVQVAVGDPVAFDYLIISAGSGAHYFGVPGAQENALALYSLSDALLLRNRLLSLFEAADSTPALLDDGILNVVVVGGGPTGIEVSGAIAELVSKVLSRDFHDLDVRATRVVLVEQSHSLLAAFSAKSRDYARRSLERRGVEIVLGTAVDRITDTSVELSDGSVIPTHLVVWAAGVRSAAFAGSGDWELGRGGRIRVEPDLSIPGHPEAFAIGDIADIADGVGGSLPQLAQVALQGGKFAAKQIIRSQRELPRQRFRYFDKGIMATIGRHAAVAELPRGPRLTGFLAWLAWLFLHLLYLIGARNRASVMINWSWNYITWESGPRLILAPEESPRQLPPGDGP